jgi:hypothetical protein
VGVRAAFFERFIVVPLEHQLRSPPNVHLGYPLSKCAAAVDNGFKCNPLRGEDALHDHTG